MVEINIGLTGILVATVVGMVLGALWYSPVLFGNRWMKCIGKTPETMGSATWPMTGSVFANVLSAVGVSIISALAGVDSLGMAVCVGLLLGLLIIFPAYLSDSLFSGWGTELLLIQSGYRIVGVLLMSMVLFHLP